MQLALFMRVLARVVGVALGVGFSLLYPLVPPDASIVTLFAFLGLLIVLVIEGVWNVVTRK